jgi:hypothetical protein
MRFREVPVGAIDHQTAAALPSNVMNSRLLNRSNDIRPPMGQDRFVEYQTGPYPSAGVKAILQPACRPTDRFGSFASILPCPICRPPSTTPDITMSDRDPSACRPPALDLQSTATAAVAPAPSLRSTWRGNSVFELARRGR